MHGVGSVKNRNITKHNIEIYNIYIQIYKYIHNLKLKYKHTSNFVNASVQIELCVPIRA